MVTTILENCRALGTRTAHAGVLAILLAGAAGATTITTTNFNTWKSVAYLSGAPTELNFYPINATSYNTAAGITLTPSGASTPGFDFTGLDNGSYSLTGDIYNKTLAGSSDSGAYVNVVFTAPENAVLLGFGNGSASLYTVTLSDGETFSTTARLFGVSVSHNITSLTISTAPGVQSVINDFWFGASSLQQDQGGNPGTPASTPEPATVLLLVGGSLMLGGARRKLARGKAEPSR